MTRAQKKLIGELNAMLVAVKEAQNERVTDVLQRAINEINEQAADLDALRRQDTDR